MIAVHTFGHNLGHIVNCNSHLKEVFGYEKKSVLDKKVTRLMPKVYADLHNTFILNYLKGFKEDDHDQN